VVYADNAHEALNGADALVVVTEWNEFRFPDFERMRNELRSPVVFDGRNLYDPRTMSELGFEYFSIGRPGRPGGGRPGPTVATELAGEQI
jgi:UDPglucose 6-dehydrogenase